MEAMTMGKRIMTLRKQRGLTQEQLADQLNVSPQAVSKWENDISCPDISLVPKLAGILGVSSDVLLGMAPMEQEKADPASQTELPERESVHSGEAKIKWNWSFEAGSGIGIALLFILVGGLFFASRKGLLPFGQPTLWGMIWPCVLLGLGVGSAVKERSPFGLGVGLLGLYYLLYNLGAVTAKLVWGDIWPILLILLGLNILTEKLWPKKRRFHKGGTTRKNYVDVDGKVESDCAFGEDHNCFSGEVFRGGKVELSFGKGSLDLSGVTGVEPGAVLDVDVSFGEYELILPSHIRLEMKCNRAFGSIETTGNPDPNGESLLILMGDVAFGNLHIRYC